MKNIILLFLVIEFALGMQSDNLKGDINQFPHDFNKIFSVPTADVLKSKDVNIVLGGAFGFDESKSFLGNIGFGLGDFADVELNIGSLIGTIIERNQTYSTAGMKFRILNSNEIRPSVAIGLKSSNDWDRTQVFPNEIQTSSPRLYDEGLRGLDYSTRMTILYAVLSKIAEPILEFHMGGGIMDIRYKNIQLDFISGPIVDYDKVYKKNQLYLFGGIVYKINPKTHFVFEAQSLPYFTVDLESKKLTPRLRYLYATGVRYIVSKVFVVDSGIRFQSNFQGIADAQYRIGINFFFLVPL